VRPGVIFTIIDGFLATFREAMGFATNRPPEPPCQHRSDIVPQNGKTLHAVVF
jgi:hypothetical protein